MKKQLLLLLLLPFLAWSCVPEKTSGDTADSPAETPAAPGSQPAAAAQAQPKFWELSVLGDPAKYTQVPKTVKITLYMDFFKKELIGEAGCNSYSASFEASNGELTVGDIITTKKACSPEVMDLERNYLDLLHRVISYKVTSEILTLDTSDGKRLIFMYWVTD